MFITRVKPGRVDSICIYVSSKMLLGKLAILWSLSVYNSLNLQLVKICIIEICIDFGHFLYVYIPTPDTNIVNVAFMADQLNSVKSTLTLLTVDMYTINAPKHSSLV